MNNLDILVFGAHPDDVELGIGGIIAKYTDAGLSIGIVDLTLAEMSSRGTIEERQKEAQKASAILNVSIRENLKLPDSNLESNPAQRLPVINVIRKYRPKLIIAPMEEDKHPDHHHAHFIIRESNYFAGIHKIGTEYPPYRCPQLLYYYPYYEVGTPNFIVDISDFFHRKIEALKAYQSQFYNPNYSGPQTFISSESFWNSIRIRSEYWGSKIGVKYAETLYAKEPVPIDLQYWLKHYE